MLRITAALDLFTRSWTGDRLEHGTRFYLDDRGHVWRAERYRTLHAWRRGAVVESPEPGEFYDLAAPLRELRHLRARYREHTQSNATRQRAHLARWRIVRATTPRSDGEGHVERFGLVELATLPKAADGEDAPDLRPVALDGWTLADHTQPARIEEEEGRAHTERWQHAIRQETRHGAYTWLDREHFLRFVRPSRTTKTATAHYAEHAGRWRRVSDPADLWRQRDTVEVELRLNDPRLSAAVYKRRGRVDSFQSRRACRIFHAYDTVLDSGAEHRVVRAPGQEAAALRMLMDRARRDLAGAVEGERRRKRCRAAERRAERESTRSTAGATVSAQLGLF